MLRRLFNVPCFIVLFTLMRCPQPAFPATIHLTNSPTERAISISNMVNLINYNFTNISARLGDVKNVIECGFDRTGVTNCTLAFQSLIASIGTNSARIVVPPGVYVLDTVTITNDVFIEGMPGAIFFHQAAATGPMLNFQVPQRRGGIRGMTFDGNKANQTTNSWHMLVDYFGDGPEGIQGNTFTNWVEHAIRDWRSTNLIVIRGNNFVNGAEHGGVYDANNLLYSIAVSVLVLKTNAEPTVYIEGNRLWQDDLPSELGRGPGGIIVSGTRLTGCHAKAIISRNWGRRMGQNFAGHKIGFVDLYNFTRDCTVSDNIAEDSLYTPFKLSNTKYLRATGNVVNGMVPGWTDFESPAFGYWGSVRDEPASESGRAIIANNQVYGLESSVYAYYIAGQTLAQGGTDLLFVNNYASNSLNQAVELLNWNGTAKFANNDLYGVGRSASHGAFTIANITTNGSVILANNTITGVGGHGLFIQSLMNGTVTSSGDRFLSTGIGSSGAIIANGATRVSVIGSKFENSGGGTALQILSVTNLTWDANNEIVRGSVNYVWPSIVNLKGSFRASGSPATLGVSAGFGTLWTDTATGISWVKQTDTGTNGWYWTPAFDQNSEVMETIESNADAMRAVSLYNSSEGENARSELRLRTPDGYLALTRWSATHASLARRQRASIENLGGSGVSLVASASQAISFYHDDVEALSVTNQRVRFPSVTSVRVPYLDGFGYLQSSDITPTELGYLTGLTGPLTTLLAGKITKTSGTATLVAGEATVSTAAVTADSRIFLTIQSPGGTVGAAHVSARSAGVSFTITSTSGSDTSTVGWMLFEP